ncbi:hypothetical protein G8759_19970 [Spirosoma aureum]|uniref:Uncharacterized protein n=1 Tax=Spirosoma aureum TaxID=2692134 RepID=A0A6G9AQW8_9BACT|nr:hypothetical protein [Spirosoma aureum]QIP14729.1 hypothetical protein G8759_19970 [Spirosoma aureum]
MNRQELSTLALDLWSDRGSHSEINQLEQLSHWLDRPVYTEGVVLYEQLIGAGFLLTMLKRGPDDYNRQRLTDALQAKRDELASTLRARQLAYPEPIVAAKADEKLLLDERTVTKERFRMKLNSGSTGDEETEEWAFRVLDIRDQLGAIYGERDFFDQHGYLPEVTSIDPEQNQADLLKRRNTLRTYVTRYKNRLQQPLITDEQQQSWVQLLQQYQSELHQVDQQLTALTNDGNPILD